MCGDAARLDLEADETAVCDSDLQLRRFGNDRRIGGHVLEHRFGADGRELLVGDRGDNHVAALLTRGQRRDEHRRQRALHVVASTPVEPAVVDAGLERRFHAGDADRVEMTVQEERPATAAASPARDHTRPLVAEDLDLEAASATPLCNDGCCVALPCAA